MMEESSVTAFEYDRTQVRASDITIERLEFGKFCISPDGPIESNRENIPIEHSQLGWSRGFPEELISTCYPTRLGIVQEDGEAVPLDNVHGTVLRPVVRGAEKRVRQVFYRVRARAEEGEGKSGRRYTLARYQAVSAEQVDPLTMLRAMNSVSLSGITRADAHDLSPIVTEPQEPQLDRAGQAFLRQALIYILSGVALSITEEISETKFFNWVAAVHDRLPPVLRPHLSAGWNVGSSFSGKLSITYTTRRAASAALFSQTAATWTPPEHVTTWNAQHQPVTNSFFEERLEPGRLFERYVRNEASLAESSEESLSTLVGSLPAVEFPELPGWHDPGTVKIFRYPGLQVRDQLTMTALTEWLESGTDEECPPVSLDARGLSYQANRLKMLTSIIQALGESSSRPRVDQALWFSIIGKIPPSFTNLIEGAVGAGAKRARLIAAIAGGDVFSTLSALQSTPPDESHDLPENVTGRLLEILNRSLQLPIDRAVVLYHSHLLLSPAPQYREWVEQHSLELMRVLASDEEIAERSLKALANISDSESLRALRHFLTNGTLTPGVESVVRRLDPDERDVFILVFNQRWEREDELTAQHREALLNWFRVLQPKDSRHVLLRLASGAQLTDSEVIETAEEIESRYVPESLLPKVAELALRRWSLLRQRISSESRYSRWLPVTLLWPRPYARVLGRSPGTKNPSPEIVRIAHDLQLGLEDLEYLLTIWFPNADVFREAAPLLWDWAVKFEPRRGASLTAFDLCRPFLDARLPDGTLSKKSFDDFVRLVRESRRGSISKEALQQMWQLASRDWQIKLLLTLFPQENLEPSSTQLSLLIPHRQWLTEHLRESRFDRKGLFGVATQPFHGLSSHDSAWRDEFVHYPIWAAFKGVPVSTLPRQALRRALRVYTESDEQLQTGSQPEQIIQKQTRLCLTFLSSYQGAASEDGAIRRVLYEFVLRVYCYRWSRERFEAAVASVGVDMELPGYKRTDKYQDRFGPSMYDLIRHILNLCDRKSLTFMIKEFYKHCENAARD
ncbi:MAG TPA: hypothetical protein VJT15_13510 [Pyrinomonadaceae bacterium]|nr:hypothetical protein [Pyrinomonadaceae bacterium]